MITNIVSTLLVLAVVPTVSAGFWSTSTEDMKQDGVNDDGRSEPDKPVEYGVDVSFPMHYAKVSENYPWLDQPIDGMVTQPLGNRQAFYDEFLETCKKHFGSRGSRCVGNEMDRVAMNLRQPQSMQNYTSIGFKKIKTPENVWRLVKDFWDKNKHKPSSENWGVGNTYTNNWQVPTEMVSVEDKSLRGGGGQLKNAIWEAARVTIQEWTGEELTPCSLYGIRVYKENSVLATHVDRLPLVSSAIINVDQDLDEPWPLEVYTHDGKAVNVTMEPGDMVLYESHSVLHGRPFPLKGRYMANLFVHFEPTGHSLRHNAKMEAEAAKRDIHEKYQDSLNRGVSGHENDQSGLPSYIVEGSPEDSHWRQQHPDGQKSKRGSFNTGSTVAHLAAQTGNIDALKQAVEKKKDSVNATDRNGWTPLHEGARAGNLEVVKYLVEQGADINAKTKGAGGSALWWAKQSLEDEDPVVSFLESVGALEIGPDL